MKMHLKYKCFKSAKILKIKLHQQLKIHCKYHCTKNSNAKWKCPKIENVLKFKLIKL